MYDIAVGIPSYNEGKRISFVIKQVDKGLQRYYPGKKAVIVNLDGGSSDDTRDVFYNTKTKTEKLQLWEKDITGKGNVLKLLFEFMKKNKVKYGMTVDSDLKSIRPEWVKLMINPLEKGYDFCTPFYSRHKYDGTITNNIVYPLVYGLYCRDIRQPIGGEFSFGLNMVRIWLKQRWRKSTRQFGIDNFMTTTAVIEKAKICQVGLGTKKHKPSAPSLNRMFREVVDTLFYDIRKDRKFIKKQKTVKKARILNKTYEKPQNLGVDKKKIKKKALEGIRQNKKIYEKVIPGIDPEKKTDAGTWCSIVYSFLENFKSSKSYLEAFSYLYFMRVYSFIEETEKMSQKMAEKEIKKQAKKFFKKRKEFTS
ncbi:glycosyltransferase [Candidatus Woesearchaeota archaeon]|nr:glycosyltransferase [Candidatus Woesearchaeota archaeon]